MSLLGRAVTSDDVLVWLHGRRIGIVGDGQAGDESALVVDGKTVASNRMPAPFIVKTVAGSNGAGPVTVASAVAGDTVVNATDLSFPADASADFEATISVSGQIQQSSTSNLSAHQFHLVIFPRS